MRVIFYSNLQKSNKNLIWNELNIRKREWYVNENRPQDMEESSSSIRALAWH